MLPQLSLDCCFLLFVASIHTCLEISILQKVVKIFSSFDDLLFPLPIYYLTVRIYSFLSFYIFISVVSQERWEAISNEERKLLYKTSLIVKSVWEILINLFLRFLLLCK